MRQVAARVWNEIAASEQLAHPQMKQLFSLNQKQMDRWLDEQADRLSQAEHPDAVISAYQQMAPLLAESEAISQFINKTDNSSLRQALPEVLNAPEAVAIAAHDRPLNRKEQQTLLGLLRPLEPATLVAV